MAAPVFSTRPHRETDRALLAVALAAHKEAAEIARGAAEAAGRGHAAAEAAQAALAAFGTVDQDVAAHRATALRAGTSTDLPVSLVDQRQRQSTARQEAEDAARTAALLDAEAVTAAGGEAAARAAVETAIWLIQVELAHQQLAAANEAAAEAGRLRTAASGVAIGMNPSTVQRPGYSSALAGMGYDLGHHELTHLSPVKQPEMNAAWQAFCEALRQDPHAPVPSPLVIGGEP